MWRRAGAGSLRVHLAGVVGHRVRRRPLARPLPTIPSSSSSFSFSPYASSHSHRLGIFRGAAGAPYRALSTEAGASASARCWNCGSTGAFLSCGSCGSVQPVDPAVDYFQIFGLERGYNITENNLEGKYKEWQKKLHPDLVHTKSEKEREFAAEQSARVIDAYRTLSRPLSRALYLLKLEGVQVDEEKTINDPKLLMEMMEIREAVSDASDSETLEKIQSQIRRKLQNWSSSFQEAFDKRDFNRAVEATQRMRLWRTGRMNNKKRPRTLKSFYSPAPTPITPLIQQINAATEIRASTNVVAAAAQETRSEPIVEADENRGNTSQAVPIPVQETHEQVFDIVADPGLRKPIEEYDVNIRDAVRREYLLRGPCQPVGHTYPKKRMGDRQRSFHDSWFQKHNWLEYSVAKDAAFCFCCYLFKQQRSENYGVDAFINKGFSNWKKATQCFVEHVGKVDSLHNKARKHCEDFRNQRQSVAHSIVRGSKKQEEEYLDRLTIILGMQMIGLTIVWCAILRGRYLQILRLKRY